MRPSVVTTLKQNYLNTQHRLRITIYQFCLKFNDICSIITIEAVKSLVHCKIKSMLFDIKALRKGSMCGLYFALLQSIFRSLSLYCTKFYFFFSLLFLLTVSLPIGKANEKWKTVRDSNDVISSAVCAWVPFQNRIEGATNSPKLSSEPIVFRMQEEDAYFPNDDDFAHFQW